MKKKSSSTVFCAQYPSSILWRATSLLPKKSSLFTGAYTINLPLPPPELPCAHISKRSHVYSKTGHSESTTPTGSNVYLTNLDYKHRNPTDSIFLGHGSLRGTCMRTTIGI